MNTRPVLIRFWEKVNKDGPTPSNRPNLGQCWIWTATTNGDGYGRFRNGPYVGAHRFSYELIRKIPAGLVLDHLCRNRLCVRPTHLEPKTRKENIHADASRALAAQEKQRITCINGHLFSNTSKDRRVCRICANKRNREYRRNLKTKGGSL